MPKKNEKEDKPEKPKKEALPNVPRSFGVVKDKIFKDANEVPMVFVGTFEDCEFKMDTLEKRNFAGAKFTNCTFAKGFKFVHCNLHGATGVDNVEKDMCLVARPTPTKETKKKKR